MPAILYQDAHLVALHKPSGMLVHRSKLDAHETRFAVQWLRDRLGRQVHPVHRLDKGTSGVLLFALDRDTLARLASQFETRAVGKRYVAVVRGHPPEAGLIDHALSRRFDDAERAAAELPGAPQPALTRYRRLATAELPHCVDRYPTSRYALLELCPETGRRHQLRRHLKHIAHPIIGDATFGKGLHNRLFQQLFDSHRMLLACTELTLRHPWSAAPLCLRAPLDDSFMRVIDALGWRGAVPGGLPADIET
ncbi:pseudouridylate synthase [Pseudothauera nasutitermitis]|uniref:tRNA pseudouridine synthase C n=1 Tax=Pseudothauera nasutitermitis TaxID=2565930 RepID=A0A4S4B1T9_9RHOO|nr:pseudouridine synthase [Pseudothauera nasutitermitis]THF66496.1 pseudouridylate synthase [Pseudothauera nasutitermitis]